MTQTGRQVDPFRDPDGNGGRKGSKFIEEVGRGLGLRDKV